MTLDPQTRALLDQVEASTLPRMNTVDPPTARAMFRQSCELLDARNVPIGRTEDTSFEGPAGPVPVRIYTPVAAPPGPLPALVFFHGGGFVIGDLDTHDAPCRTLANAAQCRVIAVDYRLGPEHPFPAAVEDCLAAVRWVAGHAGDLGVDSSRIAVGGDSAGGNLSAVVSILARDAGGPKIAFQLLFYPATDSTLVTQSKIDFASGYLLEADLVAWFWAAYSGGVELDLADPRLSPARAASLAGLPPALVLTAGHDPLRDEGRAFAEALDAAGVRATHIDYPGTIHGCINMAGVLDAGRAMLADAGAALKEALWQ